MWIEIVEIQCELISFYYSNNNSVEGKYFLNLLKKIWDVLYKKKYLNNWLEKFVDNIGCLLKK